jgi:uncharacterized membrane protein SpoIIM required for sporulation
VDVDRFVATNQPLWDRLDVLARRAAGGAARLSPAELDELVGLYQRVATHLSLARTAYREPALTAALTNLTARAGSVLYGIRPRTLRAVGSFFAATFPAALWHLRRQILTSAALFLVPAVALGIWITGSPAALEATAPEAVREAYVEEDFEAYYSSDPSAQFATQVTVNNIQVAITAFAYGILLCVPTVFVLAYNGVGLGGAAGLFGAVGELPRFFGLILPHGLLELTAIFVAGGTGLRLGWTLIDPGDRSRLDALLEEGRRAIVVVIGLVVLFVVAGLIEGFVTGSPLPTWARVGVGVVAEGVFLLYAVVLGRRAAAQGLTGAVGELDRAGWVTAAPSPSP